MDKNTESATEKSESGKKEIHSFYDIVRRMMLAGIGAVALTHDEIEEFIDKLVDRGEIARKDREELIKEMRERYKKSHHGEESPTHRRVSEMMEKFSVPTKKDFDDLNKKLANLEKKIDELTKSKK
jgi:polyhydroxyalkanoate synthesis regulator phasin